MAAVGRIPKNGRNEFHKYDYVTEADILDAVRDEMAKRHLMLFPSALDSKDTPVGEKGERVFTLKAQFTVEDGDSGEARSFCIYGQGSDKLDKGAYKAATGAEKYAILKLFMIPTGDDPEHEPARREVPPPQGLEGVRATMGAIDNRRPSPPARQSTNSHDRAFVMPFANKEKLKLSDLSEKSLSWFRNALSDNLKDPAKARFHETTATQLRLIESEIGFRATTAPDDEPPPPGDEDQPF